MADQKITQLTALASAASTDVLPIVDVANTETKKITKADLLNGLQAELVSGTNIKTINSESLLGSGDIAISANPAGTDGQIQFNDSSAFGADSNLYWDNTNKRLGVGTSTPSTPINIISGNGSNNGTTGISFGASQNIFRVSNFFNIGILTAPSGPIYSISSNGFQVGNSYQNAGSVSSSFFGIKGSGSTSATTSLLVQNSSGTELLKVQDNGAISIGITSVSNTMNGLYNFTQNLSLRGVNDSGSSSSNLRFVVSGASRSFLINADYSNTNEPSAMLEVQSTTKGFLPPKMTTTQKNAISSPAAGLQVYDSTLNQMSYYNGSTWVNF